MKPPSCSYQVVPRDPVPIGWFGVSHWSMLANPELGSRRGVMGHFLPLPVSRRGFTLLNAGDVSNHDEFDIVSDLAAANLVELSDRLWDMVEYKDLCLVLDWHKHRVLTPKGKFLLGRLELHLSMGLLLEKFNAVSHLRIARQREILLEKSLLGRRKFLDSYIY